MISSRLVLDALFVYLFIGNCSPVGSRRLLGEATATIRVNTTAECCDNKGDSVSTVILSELASISAFHRITTLRVQLEEGGPRWEFHKAKGTMRDYFVGETSDRGARASFFRHDMAKFNVHHITGMIHDNREGLWFEIRPNIHGDPLVSVIPDTEMPPFLDPVIPSSVANQALLQLDQSSSGSDTAAPWKPEPQQSTSNQGFASQTRELLTSFFSLTSVPFFQSSSDTYKEDTIVDMMVIWTHSAECIKSHLPTDCTVSTTSRQNMMLAINFFLKESNTVLRNSGLHLQLRLAHGQRVTYEEVTFKQALTDLQEKRIPSVPERRLEHKADMVMLLMDQFVDYPETGIAYNNYEHIHEDYMYSVVAVQYTSVWYLPVHEVGHNFGCSHDRATVGSCNDLSKSSYGYRDPRGQFRTIMSYPCQARQCDDDNNNLKGDNEVQLGCALIPYFSNDRVRHFGSSLGGQYNNCAGQIERVQHKVANLL